MALTLEQGVEEAEQVFDAAGRGRRRLRRRHGHARARRRGEVLRLVRRGARRDSAEAGSTQHCLSWTPGELLERIWERDPTVWTGHDEAHWLGLARRAAAHAPALGGARAPGGGSTESERVVVCGMGGSSLAPLVLGRALRRAARGARHDASGCSPQAGGRRRAASSSRRSRARPSETRCHFDHLWERTGKRPERLPRHHRSRLAARAARARARRATVVAGEPTIGGRYSALSVFGLVPAALAGVDIGQVLARAEEMHDACRVADAQSRARARALRSAQAGRRGATRSSSTNPGGFGLWLEQLIAESTGKEGKGLVPAAGESADGVDRAAASRSRSPTRTTSAPEFFRFELAAAVAGAILGVNPFDQPNVEEAKDRTRAMPRVRTCSGARAGQVPKRR